MRYLYCSPPASNFNFPEIWKTQIIKRQSLNYSQARLQFSLSMYTALWVIQHTHAYILYIYVHSYIAYPLCKLLENSFRRYYAERRDFRSIKSALSAPLFLCLVFVTFLLLSPADIGKFYRLSTLRPISFSLIY